MSAPDAARLAREVERLFATLVRRREVTGIDVGLQLTATQRLALAVVVDEGPLRLGALAERIGATDPTATRAVDALEADGLVERRPDPCDRRAVLVRATAPGSSFIGQRRRRIAQLLREPLARLPVGERERLVGLLRELNEIFDRNEDAGARPGSAPVSSARDPRA